MEQESWGRTELDPRQGAQGTSFKAILSLILGLLGVGCFWIITGFPAIFFGFSARRDIRESQNTLSGDGLAIAGIITGFLSILAPLPILFGFMFFFVGKANFMEANTRASIARAKSEIRNLAVGLECYYVDHACYPPNLSMLVSPVAYIPSVPEDPYGDTKSLPSYDYAYSKDYWVLRSFGPDQVPNADLEALIKEAEIKGSWWSFHEPFIYDPTNGTNSSGDILRAGP